MMLEDIEPEYLWIAGAIGIFIFIIGLLLWFGSSAPKEMIYQPAQETLEPTNISLTIKELINGLNAINDLPDNALICIGFYEGDKHTIIGKGVLKEGWNPECDFTLTTSNKYLKEVNTNNICSIAKEIRNNGDYTINRKIDLVTASIKYRKMMSYKNCLL